MYDTTPKTRRRYCPISITVCVAAALTMFAADALNADTIYHAALTAFLLSATALITLRTGVNAEIMEAARQAGYDAGYADGQLTRPAEPVELRSVV